MRIILAPLLGALIVGFHAVSAYAAECEHVAGKLVSLEGAVEVASSGASQWRPGRLGELLCQGDTIRVGSSGRAAVSLVNDAVLRIDQNTTLSLVDIQSDQSERSWLELLEGAVKSFSRKPRTLTINTPYLNGSIEGTEFVLRVNEGETQLVVFEGTVVAANEQGSVAVPGGAAAVAAEGQAPQSRLLVNPRDQVQWALYYPAVMLERDDDAGQVAQAARLLEVGRVEEARSLIDQALAADANAGKAYALRAVINVVQNRLAEALADGEKAAALDDSTAGRIALSYAQQGNFRLSAARDTLYEAVEKSSGDGMAWARLAELELMLGNGAAATQAALKAQGLSPKLARSQMVLGFVELAAFRHERARDAFTQAIELDSADPLAHLGMGLAKISAGDLAGGRRDIEVAVGLDGSSALLRAYLGKAYFEERRSPLDEEQFALAKELDPNDPTAFLYDGLLKQSQNRPIEALGEIEQSAALNDNRAVYRSRLLLDRDRAARGASVARTYSDVGFPELGIREASRSLVVDPANAAAHGFLSEVYSGQRRREIARVSELLQAQMLQEVNVVPLQPSSGETSLNIVQAGGPAGAGFNEFTPLFQRNRIQGAASALAGSDDTEGFEAALAGNFDRYSFSLGALTYEGDGWRENNGLEQDLFNLFAQAALTERLNLQAEFRHRESTEGDLSFNFDADDFVSDKTVEREQDTSRLGLRYSTTPQSTVLLSYIHSEREERLNETRELPPAVGTTTFTNDTRAKDDGNQVEAQFLHALASGNIVLGASWSETDRVDEFDVSVDDSVIGNLFADVGESTLPSKSPRGYAYWNAQLSDAATWTLGGSYERFEQGSYSDTHFNPKLGVLWDAHADVRVRAAAFQSTKPVLVNNRTLEPTQVAGFNQLFDDINGTRSTRYGLGLDWRASSEWLAGMEITQRDLDELTLDFSVGDWITEERQEQAHKLYLAWTATPRLAVNAELVYDLYESDSGIATEFDNLPEEVETWSVPIGLRYFAPSGLFAGLTATYVDQAVRRAAAATAASGDDQFTTVDASVGYRLAKRRGLLSLSANNLFDTEFSYQDDSYRQFRDEPSTGPYFPARTVMARVVLSF